MDNKRLLGALTVLVALAAAAQARAQDRPPPVGDLEFVDSGRTAVLSRFGATYSLADMRDRGATHSEAVSGRLGFDWVLCFATFGDGSAIIADLGMNLDMGATLARTGNDLALGDFVMNLDATFGVGFRQDLAIETYVMGWVGYRFGLPGQLIYLEDDLVARMWHLGYLDATFRHEFLAVEAGVGFGQGGLYFHAGPRLWWFDSVWIGGEVTGWITPGERELLGFRGFIELRQE